MRCSGVAVERTAESIITSESQSEVWSGFWAHICTKISVSKHEFLFCIVSLLTLSLFLIAFLHQWAGKKSWGCQLYICYCKWNSIFFFISYERYFYITNNYNHERKVEMDNVIQSFNHFTKNTKHYSLQGGGPIGKIKSNNAECRKYQALPSMW